MSNTNIVIYVEGGNVQGADSNNANVNLKVFDVDNLKAEGKSRKQIEKMWKAAKKKYAYPVY